MDKPAWIDIKSVCSECEHELDYAVVREDILKSDQGFLYKQYTVRPANCPNCNKFLVGVRIRKERLPDV